MKRLLIIFTAVAVLFAAGCETENTDIIDNVATNEMSEVCIIAEAEADSDDTRVSLNGNTTCWEVGDRITVALVVNFYSIVYAEFSIKSSSDISADGKRARFYGEVPTGSYYAVTALYPAVDNPSSSVTLNRNAANNIFMSSYKSSNDRPVLTVKAGVDAELPLSFSHLMHKMDFNLSLAEGYTTDDLKSQNIIIEVSATANNTPISFTESQPFNLKNNTLSSDGLVAQETITARGNSANFHTMLFPLSTTKDVAFTFGVYIDGEKRYEIRKPESGSLSTFKMSAGKTTTVNLVLSEKNSTIGGAITTEAITLRTSKSSIKANGVDSATLSVVTSEEGKDVTAESVIYVNGSKFNSTKFVTTTAGIYTLYAERNGAQSEAITINAEEVTTTGKRSIFAEGVTLTSGWYDVNKKSTANSSGADAMMCWAASSSNIAQWFQDCYVAAGNTLPAGCPNGTSSKYGYELQIMDVFRDNWENLARGNWTDGGVIWYFEGRDLYTTNGTENRAYPRSGTGGYFKSQWTTINAGLHQYEDLTWGWLYNSTTYIAEINNYNWRGSSVADPLKRFSEYIIEAFKYGMSSMAVAMSSNFNGAHAVTVWGYEIDDATGYVTKLYIADSDDGSTPVLQTYTVNKENGNAKIVLNGYATYYPFALYPMSGYGSAGN